MTKEDIIHLLDSWENLEIIVAEISGNKEYLDMVHDITLNHTEPKSWRAAYLLDKIHDEHPHLITPYLESFIKKLPTLDNLSKKRHFLKLISMNTIPRKHFGFLVDYCINVFTSEKEPIANRVHAMQILYNISLEEPELKSELIHIIEHEMEYHATPGILSRGKKLVGKLRKL